MGRGASPVTIHASAVAVGGRAALILGPSGAGKSGLVLQVMARGGKLVADDRVALRRDGEGRLLASAPAMLSGMVEARGIGLLRAEALPECEVVLAVDLGRAPGARMPHSADITYLGSPLRLISGREVPNLDVIVTLFLHGVVHLPG